MLTEEEIEEAVTVRTDTEPISYIKPLVPKFENASTWSDMGSCPLVDAVLVRVATSRRPVYEGQNFGSKEEVVHAIKACSIKSHQQYYVYKSSTTLLKLKFKRELDYP